MKFNRKNPEPTSEMAVTKRHNVFKDMQSLALKVSD